MSDRKIPAHIRVRIKLKPCCFIPGLGHYQTTFKGKPTVIEYHTFEFVAISFQEVLDDIHQPDIDTLIVIFEDEKTITDE